MSFGLRFAEKFLRFSSQISPSSKNARKPMVPVEPDGAGGADSERCATDWRGGVCVVLALGAAAAATGGGNVASGLGVECES